jgi:uncharacterized small protein (DUF1192 family)
MQSLEKRIAALESMRGTGLEALTDDELEARIAVLVKRIAEAEAAHDVNPLEVHHAEH